jgi:hypothetical protein
MTREEFENRRHTVKKPYINNGNGVELQEYMRRTWDSYGNVIERNPFILFIRFFEPKIKKGDTVEIKEKRTNPDTKKKETVYLQGIWDGKKVEFPDKEKTVCYAKPWLRLVSREYRINIFGFKFIIKRVS